jgi:threonine dehydrogenase-like Zn-dependent dehydrogenase
MKAVVFHGIGDIRLDEVADPRIEQPTDAIVRITASAICGTDLHMVRGTMPGMKPGTILGHEAVGIVEEAGKSVRNFKPGDRVVVPSTIACGYCSYCRTGYQAQCDHANPNGPSAGTAFFGGPETTGPFNGLHAEHARTRSRPRAWSSCRTSSTTTAPSCSPTSSPRAISAPSSRRSARATRWPCSAAARSACSRS